MKILAIESSGLVASAAIATESALLAEYTVNFKKTHSQTLLPMVEEIVNMLDADLKEVDAIAVSAGPIPVPNGIGLPRIPFWNVVTPDINTDSGHLFSKVGRTVRSVRKN